ncbi:Bax protein [Saccharicrinis carchari]|uniref:Bax protein n=1 Tax=Saccharicrinis carchari TaxID=1168039 RepID=A0A521BX80_SACCC|nr:glucosaminidase domain-containing protein [Saccharicrinis carchari]SMO51778.1 Bax protein [Saccharicrinis carchari]
MKTSAFKFKDFTDFLSRRTLLAILIVFAVAMVVNLVQPSFEEKEETVFIRVCKSTSKDSILAVADSVVWPVLYQNVPNLQDMDYKERMQKFIDMMLPSVLMAREKIIQQRHKVLEINAAVKSGRATVQDSLYLEEMKLTFKTNRVSEVLRRLHPHPVSIVLAQAAIESGWGTSRFVREANNIFGIWSYNRNEKRIKASESRGETSVYLRKYDSLFESIYDYYLTIAKANAYKEFREARLYSDNPYRLIWYLSRYSEKRYEYVRSLRNVIEFNDLHNYDDYQLAKINKNDAIWQNLLD